MNVHIFYSSLGKWVAMDMEDRVIATDTELSVLKERVVQRGYKIGSISPKRD